MPAKPRGREALPTLADGPLPPPTGLRPSPRYSVFFFEDHNAVLKRTGSLLDQDGDRGVRRIPNDCARFLLVAEQVEEQGGAWQALEEGTNAHTELSSRFVHLNAATP